MSRQGYTRYSTTDSFARPILQLGLRAENERQTRRKRGGGKKRSCLHRSWIRKVHRNANLFRDNRKVTTSLDTAFRSIIRWGERCIYIKYIPLFLPPSPSILHVSIIPNYPSVNPYLSLFLSLSPRNPEIKEISTGRLPRQRRRFQRRGRDTAREARRFSWHVIARKSFRVS